MNINKFALFLAAAAALLCSSCYTQQMVVSEKNYNNNFEQVKAELAKRGYELTGYNTNTHNELKVTGTSYSSTGGANTLLGNDYYYFDQYTFSNQEGSKLDFLVKYQTNLAKEGFIFLENTEVAGCNADDATTYAWLCGDANALVKRLFVEDASAMVYDSEATYLGVGVGTVAFSILLLMILGVTI